MKKKILSEELLKEAAAKACEEEMEMYDKEIEDAEEVEFSDGFKERIRKMVEESDGDSK